MLLFTAWIFLGVLQGPPPALGEEITGGQESQSGWCSPTYPREVGALNLGQRWGDSSPTASLHIDLRGVTSAASSFEFRTFDPEGVIFFGNTSNNNDWFVLGLRRGKPEMQIRNTLSNISVSGGQSLNDGLWHQLLVKNEGESVTLVVDGDEMLTLNRVSHAIVGRPSSHMNIGVGGLLIPKTDLLTPMKTAMDGCMRRWNWLNRSKEWQERAFLAEKDTKTCFSTIRRGSFFPGNGLASFLLSDLPIKWDTDNGNWSLEVEMEIRSARRFGTLLVLTNMKKTPVLSVKLQQKDLVAQVGNATDILVPLPQNGCLNAHFSLRVTPSHVSMHLGLWGAAALFQQPDLERLQDLWLSKKGFLHIGGSATEEEESQKESFFQGCLDEILVQGSQLDFNLAHHLSNSVWSHSCPGDDATPSSSPGADTSGH